MEKKYPPRVFGWVQDNGVPYGISQNNVVFGAPQEWISIQEHLAIVQPLVEALEFYANKLHWDEIYHDEDDGLDVSGDIQCKISLADVEYKERTDGEIISAYAGLRARSALENYKNMGEGK